VEAVSRIPCLASLLKSAREKVVAAEANEDEDEAKKKKTKTVFQVTLRTSLAHVSWTLLAAARPRHSLQIMVDTLLHFLPIAGFFTGQLQKAYVFHIRNGDGPTMRTLPNRTTRNAALDEERHDSEKERAPPGDDCLSVRLSCYDGLTLILLTMICTAVGEHCKHAPAACLYRLRVIECK
jgi:hypothetical protein